jgi:hypothetical protein
MCGEHFQFESVPRLDLRASVAKFRFSILFG